MGIEPEYKKKDEQDKPPFFSSWKKLYMLVLLNLAVLIVLFYLFMKTFD